MEEAGEEQTRDAPGATASGTEADMVDDAAGGQLDDASNWWARVKRRLKAGECPIPPRGFHAPGLCERVEARTVG
jgi:hypothetical protein